MEVLWNGKDDFEIKVMIGIKRQITISLENKTRSCGYFQLADLPCSHATISIYKCGKDVEGSIDPWYSIEVLNEIYDHCLQPIEDEEM
jgi:hypothetical protein